MAYIGRHERRARVQWGDTVYEGTVTGIQVKERPPDISTTVTIQDVVTTCSSDFTEERKPKKKRTSKTDLAWKKIRQNVESGMEILYINDINGDGCRYRIRKVDGVLSSKENEMRVYKVYAVNRRTKDLQEFNEVFDIDVDGAIKQGLLLNATDINKMGDPDEIKVWVEQIGSFELIKEKSD